MEGTGKLGQGTEKGKGGKRKGGKIGERKERGKE